MARKIESRVPLVPLADLNAVGDYSDRVRIPQDAALVLAVLSGVSESGPKLVSLTPTGAIRSADTGRGYTHNEPHEGTVLNGTVIVTFTNVISSLVINVDAQQLTIQTSMDGANFDPAFTVLAYEKVSMDLLCRAIKLTNTSLTVVAGYRVWGLYYLDIPQGNSGS